MPRTQGERPDTFTVAAFIAAIVTAVLVVALPLFGATATREFGTETAGNGGDLKAYQERTSLMDTQGWSVAAAVAVPPVLAAVPLAFHRGRAGRTARVAVAVLLWAYVIVSAASVGLFFIPVAVLASVAAIRA